MVDPRPITVGERIVVHLSQFARHQDDYVCPPEVGQSGIADCLGISRAHAAIELKRQMAAGRIVMRVAHVTGMPTRRKVYHLTPRGELVARAVRAKAFRRSVVLVFPDGHEEPMVGVRAIETLRHYGVREGHAVFLVLMQTRIDLRTPGIRRIVPPASILRSVEAAAQFRFDAVFVRPIAWQLEVVLGPPHAPPVPAAA